MGGAGGGVVDMVADHRLADHRKRHTALTEL